MRYFLSLVLVALGVLPLKAQNVSLEYEVKAAYLYNFVKYVEWPATAPASEPIRICVAGRNPFGTVLSETLAGEMVNGRPIVERVIMEPEPGCAVLFVPEGANASAYLRATRGTPVLTVGESPTFRDEGGIITFVVDQGKVRFDINAEAAERAALRVSSRLMRLSRPVARRTQE